MNAEAAGPNVTTVATVTAVTKQPKTLDTNRSEVNGTYPAATASRAAKARKSVGACVTALTPVAAGLGTKLILLLWDSGSDLKGINQLKQWCGLATRVCLGAYQLEDTP